MRSGTPASGQAERRRRPAGWKRTAVVLATAAALGALAAAAWYLGAARRPTPPDVLLVVIDTVRADRLGCYGHAAARTPVLDALATQGARFSNAVAHVPLTLPSHASIFTGRTPLAHGIRDNAGFVLGADLPTVAEVFRHAGFHTAAFVSGYPLHRRFGLARGFDQYDDTFPRGTDRSRPPFVERDAGATRAATDAWLRALRPDDHRPLFLFVHLYDPHAPYDPPPPFRGGAIDPYDGEIAFADQELGRLLEALDAARGARGRVVMVTSDHGESLGEHGEATHGLFIYESTIHVPLIVTGPGVPAGRVVESLARGIDLAPTLTDLAGITAVTGAEGRSLRGDWSAGATPPDEPAYVESLFGRLSFGWSPLHGWRERTRMFVEAPAPELYDLVSDPRQRQNLASARPDEVGRLQRIVRAAVASGVPATPVSGSREVIERLKGLGYVSSEPIASPSLRDPKDLVGVAERIEAAMADERIDPLGAIAEFRAVLADDPANPLARRRLALTLAGERRFEEALAELRPLVAAGNAGAEGLTLLADCLRLTGHAAEAVDAAREASRADPRMAEGAVAEGRALVAAGRASEAGAAFERALTLAPGDPAALDGLADLAIVAGDDFAASARLESLLVRDPEDVEARVKLGKLMGRRGDMAAAILQFSGAIERQPGHGEALLGLAGAFARSGRPGEALPFFERAIAAGAATTIAWNGLAMARLESGDPSGAAAALRRSLELRPDQPAIAALLGKVEARR